MAYAKVTATGLDLFGLERTVISIRSDRKGLAVVGASREPVELSALVGGVAPEDPAQLSRLLTSKSPGLTNVTLGATEIPGTAEFSVVNAGSPERLLRDRRKHTTGGKGVPPKQGRVDAPIVALVAVPNHRDNKWDPYTAAVRPQLAVGAVDVVQAIGPTIRPAIDLRSMAALRAFFASGVRINTDYTAFIHIDALDLTTVLMSRGDVSFIQRSSGGLLALARSLAARLGQPLEAVWAALMGDGLRNFDDVAQEEVLALIDMEVRSLDARLKTLWEASARTTERVDPPHVESVYLSGPLADDEVIASVDLGGGIEIHPFRPVAALAGASGDLTRYAGRYTVAYGHALNSIALAGNTPQYALLPTDLTPLIGLELLPAEWRVESAMPEVMISGRPAPQAKPHGSLASRLGPVAKRRITALMYTGGLGLLSSTALPVWQRSRIQQSTVKLQHLAQIMSARVLQDSAQLDQFRESIKKANALAQLHELATMPYDQLTALGRSTAVSGGSVWLTQMRVLPPTSLVIDGRSESPRAFAAYLDALRHDSTFSAVTYAITTSATPGGAPQAMAPHDPAGTFPFRITLMTRAPMPTPVPGALAMMLQGALGGGHDPVSSHAAPGVAMNPPIKGPAINFPLTVDRHSTDRQRR